MIHRRLATIVLLLCAGCAGSDTYELDVSLVTGLVAGPEFTYVQTELLGSTSGSSFAVRDSADLRARTGMAFDSGRRVATFNTTSGQYRVRVRLFRDNGALLAEQTVAISIHDNFALRVHVTRDCVGVECPGSGSAELVACFAGQCVDPRCSVAEPAFCPTVSFCEAATDCGATSDCATAGCDEGICIERAVIDSCASDEWCNPNVGAGCVPFVQEPPFPCGTICNDDSAPCQFGYWECGDGPPVCRPLGARPVGATCTSPAGGTCDVTGQCVTEVPTPPGIEINPTRDLLTSESGDSVSLTFRLATAPASDVRIVVTSTDVSEGTLAPPLLTFTTTNWNGFQTVVVTGVDDALVDGIQNYALHFLVATSDPDYAAIELDDLPIANTDDETPGITVSPTSGLLVDESGSTDTFTVRLNAAPSADVTIPLSSSDTSEGSVSPTSMTFTTLNWGTPAVATVHGVDDSIVDGDQLFSILTGDATSADPSYAGMNAADVTASNADDDSPGFALTPSTTLTTSEAGGTANFSVRLRTQPASDVRVDISSTDSGEGTVAPSLLTFTSANWNLAQVVTVTGADDMVVDGNQAFQIRVAPNASSDVTYASISAVNANVVNSDNDVPSLAHSTTDFLTTNEPGGAATFTLFLTAQPTASVDVALGSGDLAECTVSPASMTFTSSNWNVAQTVTVTGVDDAIAEGLPHSCPILVAPLVSDDSAFDGYDMADPVATNYDDDYAPILASASLSGLGANGSSPTVWRDLSISGDGHAIAFTSAATNLVAGDTNGLDDVFVRDLVSGTTERVSVGTDGSSSIDGPQYAMISQDGNTAAFTTNGGATWTGASLDNAQAWVRHRALGTTELASYTAWGTTGTFGAAIESLSPDGRFALYVTLGQRVLSDMNSAQDVYLRDLMTMSVTRISVGFDGSDAAGNSYGLFGSLARTGSLISSDGRYVLFNSLATNIVAGDTNGTSDFFKRDTLTSTTTRVIDCAGSLGNCNASQMSSDGRFVLASSANPTWVTGDTNGGVDLFVIDTVMATIVRANVRDNDSQLTGSTIPGAMSDDGRFVVFMSGAPDVVPGVHPSVGFLPYVRDLALNETHLIAVNAHGDVANAQTISATISADGEWVAFISDATNMSPSDGNAFTDVFVVRRPR